MAARYHEAMQDAELLDLHAEVALLDARTDELLATLEDAGPEAEGAAWREIMEHIDCRRKLVESETRRLVLMRQMVTTEQAMVLVARITATLRHHVDDPTILAAISHDLSALVEHEERHERHGRTLHHSGMPRTA